MKPLINRHETSKSAVCYDELWVRLSRWRHTWWCGTFSTSTWQLMRTVIGLTKDLLTDTIRHLKSERDDHTISALFGVEHHGTVPESSEWHHTTKTHMSRLMLVRRKQAISLGVVQVDAEHHEVVMQNSKWCCTMTTCTSQLMFVRMV